MRTLLLLAGLLPALTAAAQPTFLGGGRGTFVTPGPALYRGITFDGSTSGGGIFGATSHLVGFVGTDEQPGVAGDSARVRLAGVDLVVGGATSLARLPGQPTVELTLPVQLGARYRHLDRSGPMTLNATSDVLDLTLGGGLGGRVSAPLAQPTGPRLVAEAALVYGVGGAGLLSSNSSGSSNSDPQIYGVGTTDLWLAARFERLLPSGLGVMVGLHSRRARVTRAPLASVGDLVDVVTGSGSSERLERLSSVRLGLSF